MDNMNLFANNREYMNRLIFLMHCRIRCSLGELGFDVGSFDYGEAMERAEIDIGFDETYAAGENTLNDGIFLPLGYLFRILECDAFERHAVILTLLSQISPETAAVLAMVQNDKRFDMATPMALCRTYEERGEYAGKYSYFGRGSKLLKYFFAEDDVSADTRLTLDKRIVDFILGGLSKTSYYSPAAILWSEDEEITTDEEVADRLGAYIKKCGEFDIHKVFNLFGGEGAGRRSCVKRIARDNGLNLMFIDPEYLLIDQASLQLKDKILRECMIFQAIPVLIGYPDNMLTAAKAVLFDFLKAITEYFEYSFAVTERRLLPGDYKEEVLIISEEMGRLSLETSARLWETESRRYNVDEKVNFFELAGEFKLTPGRIKAAFRSAAAFADIHARGPITAAELKRGCYSILHGGMGSKAVKIDAVYTWDDLVLPRYQKNLLITACNQVRFKYDVYEKWGFKDKTAYGKNVSMVFTGPPGTGKTMAAQVISNYLGLDVYKIELATVVSKYVGETEKNLNEIFDRAEKSQVILFFDEADVLFSKRTEIKDANDKYSNMESAFLLQKMEEYDGVTILATNYMQNFDEAFKRRVKFVIDFPFPNAEQRREIWQKVFPPKLPLGELDFEFLISKYELSGSNIKNIALHSSFLAAADGSERVDMKHIMAAIQNEFAKSGKIFTKEDAGEYYVLL